MLNLTCKEKGVVEEIKKETQNHIASFLGYKWSFDHLEVLVEGCVPKTCESWAIKEDTDKITDRITRMCNEEWMTEDLRNFILKAFLILNKNKLTFEEAFNIIKYLKIKGIYEMYV